MQDYCALAAAFVAADGALEDLAAMNDVVPIGLQGVTSLSGGVGDGGGMDGMGGMGRGELVRERSVTFMDGSGAEQEAYDPLTTARAHMTMSMEGTITRDGFEASVSRARDMWVSGLEGEETTRQWDGTGSESHDRSRVTDEFGTRTYEMDGDATIDGVVRTVDRTTQPYPLSGTITRRVRVTITNGPNGDETRERTVVITFDGTRFPLMTVDGEVYELDLDARSHQRPHHRRRDHGNGGGQGQGG